MNRLLLIISLAVLLIACKEQGKYDEKSSSVSIDSNLKKDDMTQVVELLLKSNRWFKVKRENWVDLIVEVDGLDNDSDKWGAIVNSWTDSSGYFSSNFVKRQMARQLERKYDHFGLMFFEHNLGDMLHSLSSKDTAQVEARLKPLSDNSYVYADYFDVVLNSVPIPDQIDDYDWTWLWDKGENGEIWLFSVEIIKENGSWVIDKIDRRFDVPQAVDDSDKM